MNRRRPGRHPPLAIGAVLMVMVYAGGHISGGHYNPAVTLGILIRGKLQPADVVPYWIAQLAGATLAAFLVSKFLRAGVAVTPMTPNVGPVLLAEFLFTFALVYVVLNTATAEGTSGNSFYGLAIGMTVMIGAFAVGDISGGAGSIRRSQSEFAILGISSWSNIWIYLVANFGAAIARSGDFPVDQPATANHPDRNGRAALRNTQLKPNQQPWRKYESNQNHCSYLCHLRCGRQFICERGDDPSRSNPDSQYC